MNKKHVSLEMLFKRYAVTSGDGVFISFSEEEYRVGELIGMTEYEMRSLANAYGYLHLSDFNNFNSAESLFDLIAEDCEPVIYMLLVKDGKIVKEFPN